ncbi:unnamed protein product, partial [Discosporangium mesarthrocarpum]
CWENEPATPRTPSSQKRTPSSQKRTRGAGRFLELRRVSDGFLLFQTVSFKGAPKPAFSRDSSLLLHQHAKTRLGVVDCASGDSADLMELRMDTAATVAPPHRLCTKTNSDSSDNKNKNKDKDNNKGPVG